MKTKKQTRAKAWRREDIELQHAVDKLEDFLCTVEEKGSHYNPTLLANILCVCDEITDKHVRDILEPVITSSLYTETENG